MQVGCWLGSLRPPAAALGRAQLPGWPERERPLLLLPPPQLAPQLLLLRLLLGLGLLLGRVSTQVLRPQQVLAPVPVMREVL